MSLRVAAVVFCGLTASLIVVTSSLLPLTPPAALTSSKTALTAPRAVSGKETTPPSVTIWPTLMVWPPDDPPSLPPPPLDSSSLPHPAAAIRQPIAASANTRLVPRTMSPPPVPTDGSSAYLCVTQAERALVIQAYVGRPTDGRLRLSSHRRRASAPHVRIRSLRPHHGVGRSAHRSVPRAHLPDGRRDQLRPGRVRDVRSVHHARAVRRGLGLRAGRDRRARDRGGPGRAARPRDAPVLPRGVGRHEARRDHRGPRHDAHGGPADLRQRSAPVPRRPARRVRHDRRRRG